jgi:translocation and assembly module TamA
MVASTQNTWTTALKQLALVCLLWLGVLYDTHAEVSISGVDPQIRNNILAYLLLDEENCDAPDWRIRRLFSDSETEIREALEVVGYYNIEIKKKLEAGDSCWQASFAITPGQPVKLRTVSIEIDTGGTKDSTQDVELEKTARECTLRSGDILQHANYDRCTRRIARAAKERG